MNHQRTTTKQERLAINSGSRLNQTKRAKRAMTDEARDDAKISYSLWMRNNAKTDVELNPSRREFPTKR